VQTHSFWRGQSRRWVPPAAPGRYLGAATARYSVWPPLAPWETPGRSSGSTAAPTRPVPTAAPSGSTAAPPRLNSTGPFVGCTGVEPWIIHRTNIEGLLRGTGLLQNHGENVASQNFWVLLDIPAGSVKYVIHLCTFETQYGLEAAEAMFFNQYGPESHLRVVHAPDAF
jgi:hypothetical protein